MYSKKNDFGWTYILFKSLPVLYTQARRRDSDIHQGLECNIMIGPIMIMTRMEFGASVVFIDFSMIKHLDDSLARAVSGTHNLMWSES